jgi:hypothetical protein
MAIKTKLSVWKCLQCMRLEVLRTVSIHVMVLLDLGTSILLDRYQYYKEANCQHIQYRKVE